MRTEPASTCKVIDLYKAGQTILEGKILFLELIFAVAGESQPKVSTRHLASPSARLCGVSVGRPEVCLEDKNVPAEDSPEAAA